MLNLSFVLNFVHVSQYKYCKFKAAKDPQDVHKNVAFVRKDFKKSKRYSKDHFYKWEGIHLSFITSSAKASKNGQSFVHLKRVIYIFNFTVTFYSRSYSVCQLNRFRKNSSTFSDLQKFFCIFTHSNFKIIRNPWITC